MNFNDDVVYRCRRLGPLHQRHAGNSRSLVRHNDRLHRTCLLRHVVTHATSAWCQPYEDPPPEGTRAPRIRVGIEATALLVTRGNHGLPLRGHMCLLRGGGEQPMTERLRRQPEDGTDTVRVLLDRARLAGRSAAVRNDIIGSWRRSAGAGLRPEILDVPYQGDVDDRGRLAWAARPVIRRIGEDLSGSQIGLVLTDEFGLIIDRQAPDRSTLELLDRIQLAPGFAYREDRVGTNAIGTALHSLAPTVVKGEEHFAHAFTETACAAMTVTDPRSGRVIGVVDLSCLVGGANALMLPLAKRAAWEIEQRLLEVGDSSERLLRESFRNVNRTTDQPLVAISGRSLLMNAAASTFVGEADHHLWWERVQKSLVGRTRTCVLPSPGGATVTWRCHAVVDGVDIGALLSVESPPHELVRTTRTRRSSGRDFGWESLTQTEIAVATHVSTGMTNREAAARLFVSPHTIDFHLRQLFRKLNVRSRVELTRVVLEHQTLLDDSAPQDGPSRDQVVPPSD